MTVPRSNASHDQNHVPTLMGVSTTDGTTPVPVEVDPTTGQLQVGGTVIATVDESTLATSANQTNGTQQTKLTDGTNTANVLKSDGTAAGQNAQFIAGAYRELSSLTAGALNADLVPSTDVSGYKWLSLHVLATAYSGTLTFQGSNDNSNWISIILYRITSTPQTGFTTTNLTNDLLAGPVQFRYLRVRMTAYTSGTANATLELYTTPASTITNAVLATQSGTWTVGSNSATGSAIPANAFLIGLLSSSGNLQSAASVGNLNDGAGSTNLLAAGGMMYNGTNFDRLRSNEAATLLASAARTTTQTSADLVNYNGKSALLVTLDMTTVGTGSVTVSINRKDSASGKYINLLTGSAITTNSTNVYKVGPDITAAANAIAQDYLGRTFQIVVTANNANSATYSVGYELVR